MFTATKDETLSNIKNSGQNFRDATDKMGDAKDDLTAAANKAGRKVRGLFNSASDELSHAADTVTSQIHDKPVQSTMVALGVGFILGVLLRR